MDPYWPAGQALPCDLRHLRDLKLTSHHGRAFTFREVRGRFTLVVFFYASCSGICPLITSNMKALSAKIQEQADLQILSITVNPELDDPESLRAYLEHHAVTQENWTFLTGPRQQIEALAREQFGGDVRTREGLEGLLDFVHTENVYLVDKEGYLRGIYRGRGTGDLLRLLQDLAKLRSASKA